MEPDAGPPSNKTPVTQDLLAETPKDSADTPLPLPPTRHNDHQFRFNLPLEKLSPGHTRKSPFSNHPFLSEEIPHLEDLHFTHEAPPTTQYAVPFIAKQRNQRTAIDYRAPNRATEALHTTITTLDELLINVKGTVFSTLGLSSAYQHLRLDELTNGTTNHLTGYLPRTLSNNPQKTDDMAHLNHLQFPTDFISSIALDGSSTFQINPGSSPPSSSTSSSQPSEEGRDVDNITKILDRYAICARAALEATQDKNKRCFDASKVNKELEVGDKIDITQKVLAIPINPNNASVNDARKTSFTGLHRVTKKLMSKISQTSNNGLIVRGDV
jgi:hypothetical protein